MSTEESIHLRCYGAIKGQGPAYVELDGERLSIVVGHSDLHLMMSVDDWKKIAAAVNRLLDGPITHRITVDDVAGTVSVKTPVAS